MQIKKQQICLPVFLLFSFLFLSFHVNSSPAAKKPYIPEVLTPWVDWVLNDIEEQIVCTPLFGDTDKFHCNWPLELHLHLSNQGGTFEQTWIVESENWVTLPGSTTKWPQNVQFNSKDAVVIEKNGVPRLYLSKGTHNITGQFSWTQLPESLTIPSNSGLVSLLVNNETVPFPKLDTNGQLWLKRERVEEKVEDRLKIDSFRLVEDTIPAKVILHCVLDVAGTGREVIIGPLYEPNRFVPLSLSSKLPTQLEQDGRLKIQVRPGRYKLNLTLRHQGPLKELVAATLPDGLWPREEIWAFNPMPDLRLVEIVGGAAIDPLQTAMPDKWKRFPTYKITQGDILQFKEIKRGDPQPAPDQLTLNRKLWLRFDGTGYTIEDTIEGKKNTNWRLEIDPKIQIGKASVDGTEQFITKLTGSENAGIELRNGIVHLVADSILTGTISSLPATGWKHDFQKVESKLFLPPGWKILNATGIDNISRTWIKRWTLLDFFIVLIFTIAVARVISIRLSIIAFLTLVLLYHEPNAPRYVWLAILLGITLLKYLPDGKLKGLVKGYQLITLLLLVGIAIPYTIETLRIGIYPQLAKPWASMSDYAKRQERQSDSVHTTNLQSSLEFEDKSLADTHQTIKRKMGAGMAPMAQFSSYPRTNQVTQYDPKALNQTGPGLPRWQPFTTIPFSWSGPVEANQRITFVFIGPKINLALAFLRVTLILILTFGLLGVKVNRKGQISFNALRSLTPLIILLICINYPSQVHATEIPSQELLNQLQKQLLEKDNCFPHCAAISSMTIDISGEKLSISANIDAQNRTAIPLPSHVQQWIPQSVHLNKKPPIGLMRINNTLWAVAPAGKHKLELSGTIRKQNSLQLPFPLKPHKLDVLATGWTVEGIHPDGNFDSLLQFKRVVTQDNNKTEILETGILPSFIQVERTLMLGLVWKIQTRVQRLSPSGSAIVLDIPLLSGESVVTKGVRVQDEKAKINLRSNQRELVWESFLDRTSTINLQHSQTSDWTEIWQVDISPIYHMEYQGIPVIHHKSGNHWHPTWHPWPGEKVSLQISRPTGIKGQTMTVEKSHLIMRPGHRTTSTTLKLLVKSSQGGQHSIKLPPNTKLQEVKINNKPHPLRLENNRLALPIIPGSQSFEIQWLESRGMTTHFTTSEIDLGVPSVNSSADIFLPANRWPLFIGGEQLMGPAVLFWSVLIVVFLAALGLSLTRVTPLRFYHWLLLGIGMSMSNLFTAFCVVGWLLALGFRKRCDHLEENHFNLVQIGIVIMTFLGIGSLIVAISYGLLGHPDMNIIGNGSSSSLLRWYHDVSNAKLPQGWVLSIPMFIYRIAMLMWALWVSFWLISILKWGWQQFMSPQLWKKKQKN